MPDLKCTVQTCVHNYKFLCDLDKIQVGGDTGKDCTGDLLRQLSGEKRRQLYECSSFRPVSF